MPIGAPIDNTRLYVLDAHLQLLPVGVPGELFIGGEGVARGYLGQPELTADRFVPDPFRSAPGARMYRTGDLVRRLPGGDIEFLGRIDPQLKVRGYRIEPGEIESVLVEHPDVAQRSSPPTSTAPATPAWPPTTSPPNPAAPPTAERLRAHLRAKLPDYMVPATYVALAAFPTTPNNKIDRARLPSPDPKRPQSPPAHPAPAWKPTWPTSGNASSESQGIGRDDDFFDLGGHSLLATQIVSRIRDQRGVELAGGRAFSTIRRWRSWPEYRGDLVSSSCARSRTAAADQRRGVSRRLSRCRSLRSGCGSSTSSTRWVLVQPVRRGQAGALSTRRPWRGPSTNWSPATRPLRTAFVAEDGAPGRWIIPEFRIQLPVIDYRSVPREDGRPRWSAPFARWDPNPSTWSPPLFRLELYRLDEDVYVLAVCLHHIISDNWSFGVLSQSSPPSTTRPRTDQRRPPRPRAPTRRLRALAPPLAGGGGRHRAARLLEASSSPASLSPSCQPIVPGRRSRPMPAQPSPPVPPGLMSQRISACAASRRASLFMVMLAAFASLLHRYTDADDIVVGVRSPTATGFTARRSSPRSSTRSSCG